MKQLMGSLVIVFFTALLLVSCHSQAPDDGKCPNIDSNAIVYRYLKAHNLLARRSFIPVIAMSNSKLQDHPSINVYDSNQVRFYAKPLFSATPPHHDTRDMDMDGTIPSLKTASPTNYTVPIATATATEMAAAFYEEIAKNDVSERSTFFVKAGAISDYINKSQATELEIINGLYKDKTTGVPYRTFILVAVDANGNQMDLSSTLGAPGQGMVYEHMLPCPDECNKSINQLVQIPLNTIDQ